MTGRDFIPGESEPYLGMRNHARYLSRIIRGQICDVIQEEGKVQVNGIIPANNRSMTIPPLWFSAKPTNSTPKDPDNGNYNPKDPTPKTAWGRYMPIGNEFVNIAYYNDDRSAIIGYDITATNNNEHAGYKILADARKNKVPAYASFRDLKPGEFDFKSVGDAYIFGSSTGTLLLAGKQAFIRLNGPDYRIETKASELNLTSDSSKFRVGTVFRKGLGATTESPVSNAGSPRKEFLVDLNDTIPTTGMAVTPSKAKIHFGDIVDDTTLLPKQSKSNQDLRGRISIGNDLLLETFVLEIDKSGNVVWDQNITTATDGFKLKAKPILLNSTGTEGGIGGIMKIDQTNILLGSTSAVNKAVMWSPGMKEELSRIKEDINRLGNYILRHRHPLPAFILGIPVKLMQTIQTTFIEAPPGQFTCMGPGDLATTTCSPGSGPMDIGATASNLDMNSVSSSLPLTSNPTCDTLSLPNYEYSQSVGGIFKGSSQPTEIPASNIVKIKE